MKTIHRALATSVLLLFIAPVMACSSDSHGPQAPEVTPAEKTEPAKQEEPTRSERGHLVKKVGEPAGFALSANSPNVIDFVVTAITVDPECTGESAPDYPSERGHLIRMDMEVATTAELVDGFWPGNVNWKWIDANGVTANGDPGSTAAFVCLPEDQMLPSTIGPGEKASGAIVFDVANAEGTLVFTNGNPTGWEWAVPAV